MATIPVLWLCGPSGVGKTTVGWELFSQLGDAGTTAGYVDIDQLGMCYPALPADPGRDRLKAQNLAAVVRTYELAGADCVVVSGVTDPVHGVQRDLLPHAEMTICRLRASGDEIRHRLAARGESAERIEDSLREAEQLDASHFADVCVDTTGSSAAEVVKLVRDSCAGWPITHAPRATNMTEPRPAPTQPEPSAEPVIGVPVLLVCGPTGVGKSTVGFQVYMGTRQAGFTSAYIDLDQIGFLIPAAADDPARHRLKARNLACIWQNFRAAGAQCLVLVGPIEDADAAATYGTALPSATITLVRLHAGRTELTRRISLRGQGLGSWPQPGDPLIGQSAGYLAAVADHAAAQADALECADLDAARIDTNGATVQQVADAIVAQTGWPGLVS